MNLAQAKAYLAANPARNPVRMSIGYAKPPLTVSELSYPCEPIENVCVTCGARHSRLGVECFYCALRSQQEDGK